MTYFAAYFGLFFAIGALLGFGVGYVYRGARAGKVRAEPVAPAAPTVTASPELSDLPGMTTSVATAMAAAGVPDLAALRGVGASNDKLLALADALRLEDFALRKWVNLADLQGLEGIDGGLANALLRVGVRSTEALGAENPDRIQNKLAALHEAEGLPATVPDRQTVVALIAAAAG